MQYHLLFDKEIEGHMSEESIIARIENLMECYGYASDDFTIIKGEILKPTFKVDHLTADWGVKAGENTPTCTKE
jgi:uncharacterized protein YeeX (DUF496 family)